MTSTMTHAMTRSIELIYPAPPAHWVGDGFYVSPMFSHMMGSIRTDPFLMLDYAAPQAFAPNPARPRGVGAHPHKGFETVTIAYQGSIAHRDSAGGGGIIAAGDTQWMTAGRGVMHDEFHAPDFGRTGGAFEMVQLWVNLPARDKLTAPRYQHLTHADTPVIALQHPTHGAVGQVRVIAGEIVTDCHTHQGIAQTFTPINLWDVCLHADSATELLIPSTHNLLMLVRRGSVVVNDTQAADAKQLITFAPETPDAEGQMDSVRLSAGQTGADILLMSGVPLNEPIAAHGPFVMNTADEIREAMREYGRGAFGQLP